MNRMVNEVIIIGIFCMLLVIIAIIVMVLYIYLKNCIKNNTQLEIQEENPIIR